jgi:elongation factor P hydroxylase
MRVEAVFARCFGAEYRTLLVGGAREPMYVPSGARGAEAVLAGTLPSEAQSPAPGAVRRVRSPRVEPGPPPHRLYYRKDYFASALHESAHWCIAGPERRLQVDFGYWYAPDGRDPVAQRRFEAVESKPQALEWLFSIACGYRFRLSRDNLADPGGTDLNTDTFGVAVLNHARAWQRRGLPSRAALFFSALGAEFGDNPDLADLDLNLQAVV